MFRSIPHFTLLVFSFSCLAPANARAEEPAANRSAKLFMQVIDTVIEHHIAAPTRQQMVLDALRFVAEEQGQPPARGLSERVSSADRETLGKLAVEAFQKSRDSNSKLGDVSEVSRIAGFIVPGRIVISSREQHRIQQQFAGNRYVGIGISVTVHQATKQPQIVKVIPGGAAAAAGARDNDIFESIDGQPTQGENLANAIKRLRGKEGTDVTVVLRQPQEKESREYTLTRAVVPFQTVKQPNYSDGKRVVAIGFDRFSASTVNELRKIEAQLPETVEVVTLDFRGVIGHDLHHGILIGNALLDNQPIGQVESLEGVRKVTAEPGALFGDRKIIILFDQRTEGTPLWIAAAFEYSVPVSTIHLHEGADGLVYEGVPLEGTDLVIEMPTKRLRRVGGGRLTSPQSMYRVFPLAERSEQRSRLPVPSHVLSTPFEKLAEEISHIFFRQSVSDEPKE